MSNPYEVAQPPILTPAVEHGIKSTAKPRRRRQVDMSTFLAHINNVSTQTDHASGSSGAGSPTTTAHNNPHAVPTPVDVAAVFRFVQDQLLTLLPDAPSPANRQLLEQLASQLEASIDDPPREIAGVSQAYLDTLERVPRKQLGNTEACPICVERYLDDKYALVVELPCHASHRFDLECVGPWLLAKGTCPLCRTDLVKKTQKKPIVTAVDDDEEEEDTGGMFG